MQHPLHGESSQQLDLDLQSLVVELSPGGTLAGRVHWAGAEPKAIYMLTLHNRGSDGFLEFFHLPRFALTGLTGEFRFATIDDLAP